MLCKCGCGAKTKVSTRTRKSCGHIKGQPVDYLPGHSTKQKWAEGVYDNRGDIWRENISKSRVATKVARGNKNPNWQGGKTPVQIAVRNLSKYKEWKNKILSGNMGCKHCGATNNLQVDHIKPLSLIIKDNQIKNIDQALSCDELWRVSNGRVLCGECHRSLKTHGWKLYNRYFKDYGGGGLGL